MSNNTPAPAPTATPEQALAFADYHTLTSLAQSVEATLRVQAGIADISVTDLAYHAAGLASLARETEALLKAARLTGAPERHAEAFEKAMEGNTSETYRLMVDAVAPVMGD